MARALFVIAPVTFRDEEYAQPKEVLEAAGIACDTASTAVGPCHGKLGLVAEANLSIADANPGDYDAVVFVGGGGAQVYFDDPVAHTLASKACDLGAVVAAICIAPSILGHAGLLEGRRVTSFPSQQTDLEQAGATYTNAPVEIDGRIITANGPAAAREFGRAIVQSLGNETDVS